MAHILIVEDEESVQLLVRTILESANHSVAQARDGKAALDMLETYPRLFEIIVLDLLMPGIDGFEFLSKLQKQLFQPLVIILSAHADPMPQPLEGLVSGRILKPFRRQELLDTVNHILNRLPI